jgi:hypothetical protein
MVRWLSVFAFLLFVAAAPPAGAQQPLSEQETALGPARRWIEGWYSRWDLVLEVVSRESNRQLQFTFSTAGATSDPRAEAELAHSETSAVIAAVRAASASEGPPPAAPDARFERIFASLPAHEAEILNRTETLNEFIFETRLGVINGDIDYLVGYQIVSLALWSQEWRLMAVGFETSALDYPPEGLAVQWNGIHSLAALAMSAERDAALAVLRDHRPSLQAAQAEFLSIGVRLREAAGRIRSLSGRRREYLLLSGMVPEEAREMYMRLVPRLPELATLVEEHANRVSARASAWAEISADDVLNHLEPPSDSELALAIVDLLQRLPAL